MDASKTKEPRGAPLALLVPNATVFASSFCVMVIELVAGRVIARHLGSSLYTWTSVIGIVLAGLAIGNYVGGRLADRFDVRRTLAVLFIASSAASLLILVANNVVGRWSFLWSLSWQMRVALHVALVFFLPSCLLGMISPVVAKMALDAGYKTGRTIGSVYAWGVVGSIIGTFATGFFLVSWFGTTTIILGVAGMLALMAILYQVRSWKPWAWSAVVALVIVLATTPADAGKRSWGETLYLQVPLGDDVVYSKESHYSFIKIVQPQGRPNQREMYLDALLHSKIDLEHPSRLHYSYEKVFAAVTHRLFPGRRHVDSLMVGGGGYVFSRYLEATYPGSRNDVVEIDPEVTEAARLTFDLPRETPIRSFHEDARVYVDRMSREKPEAEPPGPYDVIYIDAVDHHAMPFQLTTRDFVQHARELLHDDGAYLVNLIDTYREGRFVGAIINTVAGVFPHVTVLVEGHSVQQASQHRFTFVVVGTERPFDTTYLEPGCSAECRIFPLTEDEIGSLVTKSGGLVLTDDFAPVDNLLASVTVSHAVDRAFGDWVRAIHKAAAAQDYDRTASLARNALTDFPDPADRPAEYATLLTELGKALRLGGDTAAAEVEFRKAIEALPGHVPARLGLLDCLLDQGRRQESLTHYPFVIETDPVVRYNYATTLAQFGRLREALEQFKLVTRLLPEFAGAYNNCGNVLVRMGDIEGAIAQYELALRYEPGHRGIIANIESLRDSLKQRRQ